MSKQQKINIASLLSIIIGILGILGILMSAEHRLSTMEVQIDTLVSMQTEIRKETLPKIVSEVQKLRDEYQSLSREQKCLVGHSRKPERLSLNN